MPPIPAKHIARSAEGDAPRQRDLDLAVDHIGAVAERDLALPGRRVEDRAVAAASGGQCGRQRENAARELIQ